MEMLHVFVYNNIENEIFTLIKQNEFVIHCLFGQIKIQFMMSAFDKFIDVLDKYDCAITAVGYSVYYNKYILSKNYEDAIKNGEFIIYVKKDNNEHRVNKIKNGIIAHINL
jgi:hypothetical protein